MKILLCGAHGFIGRHLGSALRAAGHEVLEGVRVVKREGELAVNFGRDLATADWLPRLAGVDAVVNAVGILGETQGASFDAVHRAAPIALFDACVAAGVRRVVQISALGGTGQPSCMTPYMRSKRAADSHLMALPLEWTILRPSLIVGADGASSRFFRMLASLPVVGLPGRGDQALQPVHIADVCDAVMRALEPGAASRQVLEAAGPQVMSYRAMLATYRRSMQLPPPLWVPLPMPLMRAAAGVASMLPQRVFSADTLSMLEQGNTSAPPERARFAQWLGHAPLPLADALSEVPAAMLRAEAVLGWLRPLCLAVLALIWIVTALLALGIYPQRDSLALLERVGLSGAPALVALYGSALLDLAFGVLTLAQPGRWLWRLQAGLIVCYSLIIAIWLPEYWLHPFGPVLKNLPVLALLLALDATEGRS